MDGYCSEAKGAIGNLKAQPQFRKDHPTRNGLAHAGFKRSRPVLRTETPQVLDPPPDPGRLFLNLRWCRWESLGPERGLSVFAFARLWHKIKQTCL